MQVGCAETKRIVIEWKGYFFKLNKKSFQDRGNNLHPICGEQLLLLLLLPVSVSLIFRVPKSASVGCGGQIARDQTKKCGKYEQVQSSGDQMTDCSSAAGVGHHQLQQQVE
jgi:hypothetical protein